MVLLILWLVLEMFVLILVITLKDRIPKSQKKCESKTFDKGLQVGNGGRVAGERGWEETWSFKEHDGLRNSRRKPQSRGSTWWPAWSSVPEQWKQGWNPGKPQSFDLGGWKEDGFNWYPGVGPELRHEELSLIPSPLQGPWELRELLVLAVWIGRWTGVITVLTGVHLGQAQWAQVPGNYPVCTPCYHLSVQNLL